MNNNNDKNNNPSKYVLSFLSKFYLFFVSVKEKKKEKPLPSCKKITNQIIASFLIKFSRGNWDKV